ncbi:hypothetical protein B0J11DRAFT_539690 [Dendryphion nanum]|uniref:Uncharacterized protein n=1 Tax=Dendryphion nanum TaxID=256645 RepID=A0A9P9D930_9PLEO|nr:hypothetical protein B0J11DRAFT_539690 [Dendryphion nanum]
MRTSTVLTTLALALSASAKTDIAGCVSTAVGASLLWYLPDTCEQCKILDCGGGRAPPKTTVPGCAAYVGTETYQPTYLTICGQKPSSAPAPSVTSTNAYPTSAPSSTPAGYPVAPAPSSKSSTPAGYPTGTPAHSSTLSTITEAPSSSLVHSTIQGHSSSLASNSTGTIRVPSNGTVSTGGPKLPEHTGAAVAMGVKQGLMAVAMGALGVAML